MLHIHSPTCSRIISNSHSFLTVNQSYQNVGHISRFDDVVDNVDPVYFSHRCGLAKAKRGPHCSGTSASTAQYQGPVLL
jgi:hypothetical protein